jgi:uncharacterized membrane protein YjjP (DUF1212 family)
MAYQECSKNDALSIIEHAARLLLQYNMRTALLEQRLRQTARALALDVQIVAAYRQVTIHGREGLYIHIQVAELRINIAVSARVNQILDALCAQEIDAASALSQLREVEHTSKRHNRWILAFIFACAAAALAALMSADRNAMLVIGFSSAAGLLARQEMAKRHMSLFTLPFTAAFIGAVCGGLLICAGLTSTPGICLIVPALMLVPGPHFINSLHDIVENNMTSGLARLTLAAAILISASLGIFFGGWLTLGMTTVPPWDNAAVHIPLWADVILAGIAACGFGAFYNAPWKVLWTSILCGMLGHGIRYLGLEYGAGLAMSTLAACFVIGILASMFVERIRVPFAAVAFAGAVPMMPGVLMFRALGGAIDISLVGAKATEAMVSASFTNLITSCFVVGAMGLGLLLGARVNLKPLTRLMGFGPRQDGRAELMHSSEE